MVWGLGFKGLGFRGLRFSEVLLTGVGWRDSQSATLIESSTQAPNATALNPHYSEANPQKSKP